LVVDLVAVQFGLQVVQLIGVGFLVEDRRPVVIREGSLNRVGVVREVEHETVVCIRGSS
jgi:hypothetical protein